MWMYIDIYMHACVILYIYIYICMYIHGLMFINISMAWLPMYIHV